MFKHKIGLIYYSRIWYRAAHLNKGWSRKFLLFQKIIFSYKCLKEHDFYSNTNYLTFLLVQNHLQIMLQSSNIVVNVLKGI